MKINMNFGQIGILLILLSFIVLSVQANAAKFEGPNSKTVVGVANQTGQKESEHNATDLENSSAQNASGPDQTSSTNQQRLTNLNVEVTSDVYSAKDPHVYYCVRGNYVEVKNRIYLIGQDLDKVKEVRYFLHETLNHPEGVLGDPNNDFEIWITVWGGFPIKAIITTKDNQEFEKDYSFSFKTKFDEAQNKGIPQVMDCVSSSYKPSYVPSAATSYKPSYIPSATTSHKPTVIIK